jgi:tetratricopeptide (TPR) repeat protein
MVEESKLIESEECFEIAKVFLGEKKYKDAIQGFSKSLSINPHNFDSLFYRAVSQLDFGQPKKAIDDLCQLIDACPDYRKTMFIVLSIAYRRINDY